MTPTARSLARLLDLPLRDHPGAEAVAARTAAWVAQHDGLGGGAPERKVKAWKFGALAAAMYPDADADAVVLAADLTHWIAVLDDLVERSPGEVSALRAAHLDPADGHPLSRAWRDVERRLTSGAGAAFEARVRASLAALFDAYAWESRFRTSGTVPPLDAFRAWRHVSGGLPLYLLILERAAGGAPERSERLAELEQRIGNLTCWANDLLSHAWDTDTDNPINLVRVVEAGSGPAGAFDAAVRVFEQEWHGWKKLVDSDEALRRSTYVAWQPGLVAGSLKWMESTERYGAAATSTER